MFNLLTVPIRPVVTHLPVPRSLYLLVAIPDRESVSLFLKRSLRHGYGYVKLSSFQRWFASWKPRKRNGFGKHLKKLVNY